MGVANTAATFSGFAAKALPPPRAVSAATEATPVSAWRRVICAREISFRCSGFFIWPLLSQGRRLARRSDDVPNSPPGFVGGHHLGESLRAAEIFVHTVKVSAQIQAGNRSGHATECKAVAPGALGFIESQIRFLQHLDRARRV